MDLAFLISLMSTKGPQTKNEKFRQPTHYAHHQYNEGWKKYRDPRIFGRNKSSLANLEMAGLNECEIGQWKMCHVYLAASL